VRGPLVMDGYWKRPEANAETLRGGWLHTGDVAIKDEDGYFYIVDRTKDMIISGGFNIYPREVEDALMSHPSVAGSAAVIGIPDEKWGEAVKAVVELKAGMTVEADELIRLAKEKLGGVKAPKTVDFVDTLPRSPVGKVLKKTLREPYWVGQERKI
jgi:fatty-acyl-CoA synthase